MNKTERIETAGKTVEDAVELALAKLGAERGEVDVEIIETPTKGILGIGAKPAKVAVILKFDPSRFVKDFLKEMCLLMGISVAVEAKLVDRTMEVSVSGDSAGILIGKHGQTLDAVQYVLNLALNKGEQPYIGVTLDTGGYRRKRRETLESLAFSIAKKVKTTRRSVRLEPMSANERRIIHAFLQNDKQIVTFSEGEEPYRNIVVSYKRGAAEK
jgi:spoIIIJ-associated protein